MKTKSNIIGPGLVITAKYSTVIIGPLVSLLVVRYLGAQQFGYYATATAVITLLLIIPEFGISQSMMKLYSTKKYQLSDIIWATIKVSLLFSLGAYLISVLWFSLIGYEETTKKLGYIIGLTFFRSAAVAIINAALQILGKYERVAIWDILISSSQWIPTIIVMFLGLNVYYIVAFPLMLSIIIVLIIVLIEIKTNKWSYKVNKEILPLKLIYKNSWKFGINDSLHSLFIYSFTVILSITATAIEVGYFTVAFKIVSLIYIFPSVVFNQILYPKYFLWSNSNSDKLRQYFLFMSKIMLSLGIIITILVIAFSDKIILLVFGKDYIDSIILLKIMAFAVPFRFIGSSAGAIMATTNLINKKIKIELLIGIINLICNSIFITLYGAIAGAIIMVFIDILLIIVLYSAIRKENYRFKKINLILLALFLPFFPIFFEQSMTYLLICSIVSVILVIVLYIVSLTKEEVNQVKNLFGKISY